MLADGRTKGAVERKDIHATMMGNVTNVHQMRLWRPKRRTDGASQPIGSITAVGTVSELDDPDEQIND